ncbi:MAG: 7TM diverse intracellular signaling domain-containing protein [Thermodesulfobacteriota bacterium]|nr:7TM diverse intracellular signaling domain-containing protein [Thermodesulfobacteriota bacterium]
MIKKKTMLSVWPIVLAIFFCLCLPVSAEPETAKLSFPPPAIQIDSSLSSNYFGDQLQYLEDKSRKLTIGDVTHTSRGWQQSKTDSLNFGFTDSAYWFRFTIDNTLDYPSDWLLEITYPLLDYVDLYIPQAGGFFTTIEAGDRYQFSKREIMDKNFVFRINQQPGPQTYYLRIQTESSLTLEPVIRSENNYIAKINHTYPLFWIYYGAMLIMVIYNVVLFFIIRDRSYIYLVLFIVSYILFQFTLNGFSFQYLWPNAVKWANNCLPTFMGLAFVFFTLFLRSFFNIGTMYTTSMVDKATKYLVLVPNLGWAFASLLMPYAMSIKVATFLAFFSAATIAVTGLLSVAITRSMKYILASCAVLFIGVVLYTLKTFGVLPSNIITNWSIQIGSVFFVSFLSIALADKITALKNELILTNSKISQMLKSVSEEMDESLRDLADCREDEIGGILNERFTTFMDRFRDLVSDVAGNADILESSSADLLNLSEQMTTKTNEISTNANSVASSSEEMSMKMTSIASTMEQTSQNINLIVSSIEQMTATSDEISGSTESARMTTENAVDQAQNVSQKVDDLGNAAEKIGSVTEVITEISKKTNLLALNATIEAARAGEAGKGFAVVANEIKDLAKQTAEATQQIKKQIDENKNATTEAVGEIAQIVNIINYVNEIVSSIASSIEEQSVSTREIATNVAQMSQGVSEVNKSIAQCSSVANDVSKEVISLSDASTHLDENSRHVKESADELLKMAQYLAELIQKFQV